MTGSGMRDARARLQQLLQPQSDDDPDVHVAPVDALTAPSLVIGWNSPMVDTRAHTNAMGKLFVMIVAQRLDLATGYDVIEQQYARIEQLVRQNGGAVETDSGPGVTDIGNVLFLSCRIDVRFPITTPS